MNESEPTALAQETRALAYGAFFLSGASSLIFQALWTRTLHHVFGSSSVAMATVLTAFMMGLGLGAYLFGRVADRIPHPLMTYAAAELVVGVFALVVPWLVSPEGWLATVNAFLRNELGAESAGFMLVRFLCVAPILLLPTTLMGASLPLLSRHFIRRGASGREVSSVVGSLYSVNTFGAVLGVGLGGFVLMPKTGLFTTTLIAASMNVGLALVIFALRRPLLGDTYRPGDRLQLLPVRASEAAPAADEPSERGQGDFAMPLPRGARMAALIAFGVSGLAAFAYELVWTRALAMTIGSSVYSFTIILLTFLIGIAGGSAVASGAIGPRRGVPGALVTSALLVFFATSTLALDEGVVGALFIGVVLWLPVGVVHLGRYARAQKRGVPLTFGPAALLFTLGVPAVVAIALWRLAPERTSTLAGIVAVVTTTIAAFTALVTGLRRYPVLQLAGVQLFIATAAIANYVFQDEIPCAFASMVAALQSSDRGAGFVLADHVPLVQFLMFLTAGLCTLPATMGMGAMFPLALRIFTHGGGKVGEDVGIVYSVNTIGSIIGAWLTGFVLMPWLGMELTLVRVGIYVNLGLALLLLVIAAGDRAAPSGETEPPRPPPWHTASIYILAPLIPALIAFLFLATQRPTSFLRWEQNRMTLGVFRVSMADNACAAPSDVEIVFYRDGLSTTVTVEKFRFGPHVALKNNGKVDASNGEDMPTQIMVAGFPLLMHRDGPKDLDVAVVGFGSGVSVGTALTFPVASVDVIELEPAIPEASRFFASVNGLDYPLDHFPFVEMERLELINDDGRNYLASTDARYDVIISEPSNPWITGVSDLFTTDHFRITKKRLRPGGIYAQWVQLYELSPENIKTIYRTFASQFEHVVVFGADDLSSDTVLLGSDAPLPLDLRRIRAAFGHEGVPGELERAHVHRPEDVFARTLFADKAEVLSYARIERRRSPVSGEWESVADSTNGPDVPCTADCERLPVPLNTDDNMLIEFAAPHDLIGYQRYEGYVGSLYAPTWPYGRLAGHVEGLGEGKRGAETRAELALSLAAHGRRVEAAHFLREADATGESPTTIVAVATLTRLVTAGGEPSLPIELPSPGPALSDGERAALLEGFEHVRRAVDARDYATALAAIEAIPSPLRREGGPALTVLHAYLLYQTGDQHPSRRYRDAAELLERLLRDEPGYVARHSELYYYLGRSYDLDLRFDLGVRYMRRFVELRREAERVGVEALPPAE